MRWPWRRRKDRRVDDYDRDSKTRQGNPAAMRCRLCNAARVTRRVRYPDGSIVLVLYCVHCNHINRRN